MNEIIPPNAIGIPFRLANPYIVRIREDVNTPQQDK